MHTVFVQTRTVLYEYIHGGAQYVGMRIMLYIQVFDATKLCVERVGVSTSSRSLLIFKILFGLNSLITNFKEHSPPSPDLIFASCAVLSNHLAKAG